MTIAKLEKMPYAQARVIKYEEKTVLISYTTEVAEISNGRLKIFGLYSATTRKHISAFVREYLGIEYAIARTCYERGIEWDIEKGDYALV